MIRVLGVMTGTSVDGLDAACLEFGKKDCTPVWQVSRPYPAALRRRVLKMQKPGTQAGLKEWLELHRDLGEWFGKTLKSIIGSQKQKPDAIANHGQTMGHFPGAKRLGFTSQMGDPARIAFHTGLTVVAGFRDGDMAAGGEGAPLVPMYHRLIAQQLGTSGIVIHNIGGISNLTYVGPRGQVMAFDTGPGNIWIDAATELATQGKQKFDRDGKIALASDLDWRAVTRVLSGPYFRKQPPKSTGRDDFPFSMLTSKTKAKGGDLVATATWLTIESIAQAYERFIIAKKMPLSTVFLCGGGSKNRAIMEGLRIRMPQIEFASLEETGFDPQFIEAQAFALYGWMALQGFPIDGEWTGVHGFAPPAQIIPGKNWGKLIARMRAKQ